MSRAACWTYTQRRVVTAACALKQTCFQVDIRALFQMEARSVLRENMITCLLNCSFQAATTDRSSYYAALAVEQLLNEWAEQKKIK